MPEINGKYVAIPNKKRRDILKSRGPRSRKDTEVYLECVGDKIFLMFNNHVYKAAPKGIEITKEAIQGLSDSIWLVKEFLENKCKIEDVFPSVNKTEEQYIKDEYNALPVEVEKEYTSYDYKTSPPTPVQVKYKEKVYKTPEAG